MTNCSHRKYLGRADNWDLMPLASVLASCLLILAGVEGRVPHHPAPLVLPQESQARDAPLPQVGKPGQGVLGAPPLKPHRVPHPYGNLCPPHGPRAAGRGGSEESVLFLSWAFSFILHGGHGGPAPPPGGQSPLLRQWPSMHFPRGTSWRGGGERLIRKGLWSP